MWSLLDPFGWWGEEDTTTRQKAWPFEMIEEKALATASIAQVHRARLVGGEEVVVKVQHRGVEDIILEDLENAVYLVEDLAEKYPEHDYREILREWCAEAVSARSTHTPDSGRRTLSRAPSTRMRSCAA